MMGCSGYGGVLLRSSLLRRPGVVGIRIVSASRCRASCICDRSARDGRGFFLNNIFLFYCFFRLSPFLNCYFFSADLFCAAASRFQLMANMTAPRRLALTRSNEIDMTNAFACVFYTVARAMRTAINCISFSARARFFTA